MSAAAKAFILILVAAVAFGGFFVFDLSKAIIWLVFLTVSYPVLIAFFSGTVEGARFSPEHLIEIYKESLRAIPSVLKFLKDFFHSDKS